MVTAVIMPKVDMVMDTGTLVEWLKEEGEHVEKGEPLFVILTDKANIEIEAPADGTLAGVRARPDDVIPVTEVIAYILGPGESVPEAAPPRVEEKAAAAPPPVEPAAAPSIAPGAAEGKVRATPAARRIAAEQGVDLTRVQGSGPRGRIHKADVLASAGAVEVPLPEAGREKAVPLAGPRRIIAERMSHSAFTAPHVALSLRADMSEAARLRDRVADSILEKTGHKLSFTAIIARAVASVLPKHPYLNASLGGDEIILWGDVHLGLAMSLEDYLVVPVVREAQTKSLEQIVSAIGSLVERARAKRLTPAEMTGSTFTISNLGMFGIESFTAIINPPESAILAVGSIVETPVGVDGEVVLRPMMNLTLSADHRVVDGAAAARFLADLKNALENPYLMI